MMSAVSIVVTQLGPASMRFTSTLFESALSSPVGISATQSVPQRASSRQSCSSRTEGFVTRTKAQMDFGVPEARLWERTEAEAWRTVCRSAVCCTRVDILRKAGF